MKHQGDLIIKTKADAQKYADVTEVSGYLSIRADAKLDALASVGGDLYIYADAKLDALTSVGGYLSIYADAKLDAPELTSVGGGLSIHADAKLDALTSVGGYLSIYADAKLDALASVGGDLYINADAKLDALTSVGGGLYIHADAKLDALASVGGGLYIHADAKLDAPELTSVGGDLYIHADAKLDAPELFVKGFSNFKVFDGIPCAVMSAKKKGDTEILSCRQAKIKNQRIVGDKFFVAKKGDITAHGKDAKTALEELAFKIGDRDIDQYRNMPATTCKSPDEWAFVYRMVTGACRYGTQSFMESKGKLKKTYTLAEIIKHTAGAYGHAKFCEVVLGKEAV